MLISIKAKSFDELLRNSQAIGNGDRFQISADFHSVIPYVLDEEFCKNTSIFNFFKFL